MNKPNGFQNRVSFFMRITLLHIVFSCLTVVFTYASNAQEVLNRKVTIHADQQEVKAILDLLSKQANVKFTYSARYISIYKRVTLHIVNSRLADVLGTLLSDNIDYKVVGELIALKPAQHGANDSPSMGKSEDDISVASTVATISGTVKDSYGTPLPGVNVLIKGTTGGTATDTDGKFVITAAPDATLVFSFIGFAPQEVPVNNQSVIDVVLKEDVSQLSEVVVTAFGIEKQQKKLGYSVTEVQGTELQTTRDPAFMNTLTGKIAGVVVQSPNAGPGSSTRVVIRGNATFGSNRQPLYVIDGVPIDNTYRGGNGNQSTNDGYDYGGKDPGDGLSNLNPDDIETVSVLKGVGAAALYGNRAQNGVILITTKKGNRNQGLGISFNSNTVLETMVPYTEKDLQYEYGTGLNNKLFQGAPNSYENGLSWGAKFGSTPTFTNFAGEQVAYQPQKISDNFKRLFRTGMSTTNSLAFAGGSDKTTYRLSLSYTDSNSPQPGIDYKRYNVVYRGTSDIGKRLHTDYKIDISRTDRNSPLLGQDGRGAVGHVFSRFGNSLDINTLDQKDADGNFLYPYFNPFVQFEKVKNEDTKDRVISAINLKYDITSALHAIVQGGVDISNANSIFLVKPYSRPGDTGHGDLNKSNQKIEEDNIMGMLNYAKELNDDFSVNINAGAQARFYRFTNASQVGSYFIVPDLIDFSNTNSDGNHPVRVANSTQQKKVNSVFGAAQLGFRNFLFLEITGREDWNSALAKVQKGSYVDHYFYPSANVSYVFSDHLKFLPNIISLGKIRASVATTTSDPDPGQNDLAFKLNPTVNGVPVATINNSVLPPTRVIPEKTTEVEIGTQFGLFENRLNVDLAWYNKTTKDFLLNSNVSNTNGFSQVRINGGSMRNRGIELLVSGTPLKQGDFSWDVSVNLAHNKNTVLSLTDLLKTTGVVFYGPIKARVGDSFGSIYGTPARVGPNGEDVWRVVKNSDGNDVVVRETGQVSYDANGNPLKDANGAIITNNDIKLGSANPTLTGGITNTFSYKSVTLSFLIDGSFGASIYSQSIFWSNWFGNSKASLQGRDGTYIPAGLVNSSGDNSNPTYVTNTHPFDPYQQYNSNSYSQLNVVKNEFIKLRQISIGYSLPKNALDKTPFRAATFSLVGRNLFYFRKTAPLIDPGSSDSIGSSYGFEQGALPTSRTYGFNLNLQF